jgi:hypothetical protein
MHQGKPTGKADVMAAADAPHPAAEGVPQKVSFADIWIEADNQRRRHFAAEALAPDESAAPDYARRCNEIAADRGRLVEIYETIIRLIEGVRDDAVILERLAATRSAKEAAAAAVAADAALIRERIAADRAASEAAAASISADE